MGNGNEHFAKKYEKPIKVNNYYWPEPGIEPETLAVLATTQLTR